MKLIDKDALVAWIESQIDSLERNSGCSGIFGEYQMTVYDKLLSFLDTLEVKEMNEKPVSEDLEEAAWQYYDRNKPLMPSELDLHEELIDFFKAGVRWKEQNDSNLSEVLYRDNLDEMAEEYSSCTYLEEVLGEGDIEVLKARLKNTFIAGAQWQKRQLVDKAWEYIDRQLNLPSDFEVHFRKAMEERL